MEENKPQDQKPDSLKLEALRNLPKEIVSSLTTEEVRAFLHEEEWPESLREKLKGYLADA